MKTLCIDVGNTSIHYGLVSGQTVLQTAHVPTHLFNDGPSQQFAEDLAPLLAGVSGVAFCSVVPSINKNLRASLGRLSQRIFHLTHQTCAGLDLVYPKPEEIGQDRIANAIAAQEFYGIPAIVIDLGTAVTFDIVSSQGYEGGIIAPGLAVMTRYLHEQTALLPELSADDLLNVEGAIGKSTIHAMKLGVAVGFSGMIDALLLKVSAELRERGEPDPVVLSTGGSVANLTKDWVQKSRFVQDLTLMGLAVAYQRQAV
jgi:type III pantothenate kinase